MHMCSNDWSMFIVHGASKWWACLVDCKKTINPSTKQNNQFFFFLDILGKLLSLLSVQQFAYVSPSSNSDSVEINLPALQGSSCCLVFSSHLEHSSCVPCVHIQCGWDGSIKTSLTHTYAKTQVMCSCSLV